MARIPIRTVSDVGQLIRAKRRARDWDQGELAERARVSRLWINEVEQGKPGAGIARILRTFTVLDIRLTAEDGPSGETGRPPRRDATSAAITRLVGPRTEKKK